MYYIALLIFMMNTLVSLQLTDLWGGGIMANEKVVKRLKFEQRTRFGGIAGTKDAGSMPYLMMICT